MSRKWIPIESKNVADLAAQTDYALSEVESIAKRGIVADSFIANSTHSYFYIDDNNDLMFYNAKKDEIIAIT